MAPFSQKILMVRHLVDVDGNGSDVAFPQPRDVAILFFGKLRDSYP
jgi:hypothetical protein